MCFVPERGKDLGWINPNRDKGFKVKPKVKESKLRFTSTNPVIPKSQIHSEKTGHILLKNGLGFKE